MSNELDTRKETYTALASLQSSDFSIRCRSRMRGAAVRLLKLLFVLTMALAVSAPVPAQQLLQNGSFETGNFTGWTTAAKGDGSFYVGDKSMPDGMGGYLTPGTQSFSAGPKSGEFYAVSDASDFITGGPGARVLLQTFTTPSIFSSLRLSYDMFVNDYNGFGALNTGGPLDPSQMTPTQYARVDILRAGADPFSTDSMDIVDNLFLGEDAGAPPNAYTSYSFDLSHVLTSGTNYQLRFAEVDNQFVINQGVDNVSLAVVTPEFGSVFSLGGLLIAGGMGLWLRRNRGVKAKRKQNRLVGGLRRARM